WRRARSAPGGIRSAVRMPTAIVGAGLASRATRLGDGPKLKYSAREARGRAGRAGEWAPSGSARRARGQGPLVIQTAAERERAGSGARRALPGGRRGAGRPSLI